MRTCRSGWYRYWSLTWPRAVSNSASVRSEIMATTRSRRASSWSSRSCRRAPRRRDHSARPCVRSRSTSQSACGTTDRVPVRSRGSRESSGGGRERRCHEIQAVRMLDAPAARASSTDVRPVCGPASGGPASSSSRASCPAARVRLVMTPALSQISRPSRTRPRRATPPRSTNRNRPTATTTAIRATTQTAAPLLLPVLFMTAPERPRACWAPILPPRPQRPRGLRTAEAGPRGRPA